MALSDYMEEFQIEKRKLYVAICIDQAPGYGKNSPVNRMLEELVGQLKRERMDYESIEVAYVYETEGMMDVKDFASLTEESLVWYKEPCIRMENHNLNHVFFMGMALLERVEKLYDTAEKRLYFVTDEKFERVNQIACETEKGLKANPRFAGMDVEIILVREENAGGDLLDKYIKTAQTKVR